jgi:hypothetical protein
MRLGRMNMFTAQILNIERGDIIDGTEREYQDIADGLRKNLMRDIAGELTGGSSAASGSRPAEPRQPREPKPRDGETGGPFGYGVLNILFGLGSYIQGDTTGGLIVTGGYVLSLGLIIWETGLSYEDDFAGVPGTLGLGLAGATLVYGFVRPFVYSRNSRFASVMDRVNIIPVSGERGANALRMSYTLSF